METTSQKNSTRPDWVNVALGIWLILSPFALGFSRDASGLWNNICLGIVVVPLALISGRGTGALRGLIMALAAWIFFSPFVLGFPQVAFLWNNIGTAFLVITGAAASEGFHPTYRAGAT
jgi:hypothetical protein